MKQFIGLTALILLAGCSNSSENYQLARAERGDVRDVVPASGAVETETRVMVHSPRAGRVVEVYVEANAPVRAGQRLARIVPADLAITGAEAVENLAVATATLAEARIRQQQAERHLLARKQLADRGFVNSAVLDAAQAEADASAASVRRAEAQVAKERLSLTNAREAESDGVIVAPIDGFVQSRSLEVGQLVTARSGDPLFIVAANLKKIVVRALVNEPDIGRLSDASQIRFKVDAYPDETFTGHIKSILRDPIVDRAFVSYPVLIEASDAQGRLFPGMTASVEFIRVDARNVVRIPIEALYVTPTGYMATVAPAIERKLKRLGLDQSREALNGAEAGALFAQGYQRIFVLKNGRPVMRKVRLGAQTDRFVETREGLNVDEEVIVGAPEES